MQTEASGRSLSEKFLRHIPFGAEEQGSLAAWKQIKNVVRRACGAGSRPHLLRSRGGNVAVTLAVGMGVIVGAVGLGTDAATWYATRRAMQNAADLGAEGAGNSLKASLPGSSTGDTTAANEAKSATAAHGFANGGNNVTV